MGMAKQDGINAVNLAQIIGGVFFHTFTCQCRQARMRHRNHDVRALFAHFRHVFSGHFDNVLGHDIAFQIGLVPLHDLRRDKPDHADLGLVLFAVAIGKFTIKDHIGLEIRFVIFGIIIAVIGKHIGTDIGEFGPRKTFAQEIETIVEFMIADIGRVITQKVHRLVNRMHLALFQAVALCHVIAKRVALDQVTIIDQDDVFGLTARVFQQGRDLGQTDRIRRTVTIIIVIDQMRVDIGGFQNAQRYGAVGQCRAAGKRDRQ